MNITDRDRDLVGKLLTWIGGLEVTVPSRTRMIETRAVHNAGGRRCLRARQYPTMVSAPLGLMTWPEIISVSLEASQATA